MKKFGILIGLLFTANCFAGPDDWFLVPLPNLENQPLHRALKMPETLFIDGEAPLPSRVIYIYQEKMNWASVDDSWTIDLSGNIYINKIKAIDLQGNIYNSNQKGIAKTGSKELKPGDPVVSSSTGNKEAFIRRGVKGIAIAGAIVGASYAANSLKKVAKQDNVELKFTINNHSSQPVFYDRNDWSGWEDKIKGFDKECDSCRGSVLPGQSATASIGSKKKGASIGWDIGFNEGFNSGQITYARVWKQMNRNGGLDIQGANTPYNIQYSQYASSSSNDGKVVSSDNNYLFIGNDVLTGVTTTPVSCQLNSADKDASDVCATGITIYDASENMQNELLIYYVDGTNNVEIPIASNFVLHPGEAIQVQAGTSNGKYKNKFKAYELINVSTDETTSKLKYMGCNDVSCITTGTTLWEGSSNATQSDNSNVPEGSYKLAIQNDGNIVDYDQSGKPLAALW